MVISAVRSNLLSRLGGNRAAQRVASPSVVTGLGSTACMITRHLEELTLSWNIGDRKSLGFLYLRYPGSHS